MRAAVQGLAPEQLDTPYRPDGWTVRQVVHHVPDSHMNAYIRFKLALTEEQPPIKPYDEAAWANLPDSNFPSKYRSNYWRRCTRAGSTCCSAMPASEFGRTLYHPEQRRSYFGPNVGLVRVALGSPSGAHHLAARAHGLEATRRCSATIIRENSHWIVFIQASIAH